MHGFQVSNRPHPPLPIPNPNRPRHPSTSSNPHRRLSHTNTAGLFSVVPVTRSDSRRRHVCPLHTLPPCTHIHPSINIFFLAHAQAGSLIQVFLSGNRLLISLTLVPSVFSAFLLIVVFCLFSLARSLRYINLLLCTLRNLESIQWTITIQLCGLSTATVIMRLVNGIESSLCHDDEGYCPKGRKLQARFYMTAGL